ncbi:MAG TPA: LysR family transcriptional regulator [Solirubrobacterales bacterium]|jgi:DNA-binding transcriptional LysR family regulator
MLDVRRLRVLREVIARGSFSAAAESLHLSQSAVSQQIAVLEREVGIPLLERTSEGPKLTAAGEALVEHGDAVICRLEEAERELAQIAGLEGGRLRLASFPTASATLMTRALSLFRQRFPKVELLFSEDEPEDSFPALKRGDFDLAVVFDYPAFPLDFARDVEAEMIFEEPMRVALPPGHPLAAAKSVRIEDLAEEDWLCGALPSSCREQILGLCREAGFEPRISFQSEDYEVIKGFVAGGLGVTILPELAGGHPGIELRPVRGRKPVRRVWAVTRESESRSPAAEQMLGILREVCRTYRDERDLRLAA